jgi:hypothetical protein
MDRLLVCEATIKYRYERDFVSFRANGLGQVFVSGELSEYSELTQRLVFAFRTDQTVLKPFILDLEELLHL